jgi:hypothetical protein
MQPNRIFIRQGPLAEISSKNKKASTHKRHLFLFNDIIYITKPASKGLTCRLLHTLLITNEMDITDLGDGGGGGAVTVSSSLPTPASLPTSPLVTPSSSVSSSSAYRNLFVISTPKVSFKFSAKSPEEKLQWYQDIKQYVDKKKDDTVFGVPLEKSLLRGATTEGIPAIVHKCSTYIRSCGLGTEGLFRVSGTKSQIEDIRKLVDTGTITFSSSPFPASIAPFINLCTSLLKLCWIN